MKDLQRDFKGFQSTKAGEFGNAKLEKEQLVLAGDPVG